MMGGIAAILLATSTAIYPPLQASRIEQVKFGILRVLANGDYELDAETTHIPLVLKDTGFRYGIAFDNPLGTPIEWYEVLHLPAEMPQLSGDLRSIGTNTVRGEAEQSSDTHLVDQFWFDKGDPIGKYRLDLYVNGVRKFSVDFDVTDH